MSKSVDKPDGDLSSTSIDIEHIRENRELYEEKAAEHETLGPVFEAMLQFVDEEVDA